MAAPPAAIDALLQSFLSERAGRNLSAFTLRNYRSDLGGFFAHLTGRGVEPLAAGRADLRAYLARLLGEGVATASVTRKVSTVRSFYRYLRTTGVLENDPFFGVRGPQRPKRLPEFLVPEDIHRLISAASASDPKSQRDRALLELLYAAGLRVSEVAALDLRDVNLRDREVRVRGKG